VTGRQSLEDDLFKSNFFFVAPAKAGAQGNSTPPALGPRFRGGDAIKDSA
jgi:hypothetical protein